MLDDRNVDKSIIDRGWQEMSTILDAEMPVQENKRRGIVWWFFGLLFILLMLLGYKFILPGNDSSGSDKISDSVVNAYDHFNSREKLIKSEKATEIVINDEGKNERNHEKSSINKEKDSSELNSYNKIGNLNEIIDKQKDDKNPGNTIADNSRPHDSSDRFHKGEVDQLTDSSDESKSSIGIPVTNKLNVKPDQGVNIINDQREGIEIVDIATLHDLKYSIFYERIWEAPAIIEPVEESNRSHWMAYMSTRVIQYENLNGEIGMSYVVPINSRISVLPQLGYGLDRIEYYSAPASSRVVEFSNSIGLNSESLMSNLQEYNEKGSYFSLGLDGVFQVWKDWSLIGGLNYRLYSTLSGSGNDELVNEDITSGPGQAGGDMAASIAEIKLKNDLYYRAGVYYNASNRIGVGLYYYQAANYPYEVLINRVADQEATSDFFPRKNSLRALLTFKF